MRKGAGALAMLLVAACGGPSPTAVPSGAPLLFEATAKGTNIYVCQRGDRAKWTLQEKTEETLFDSADHQIGVAVSTPYATRWQASDGSVISGQMVSREDTAHEDDLPVLLFTVAARQGTGMLSPVRSVRRVRNRGGTPPARDCAPPGTESKRPYSVVYQFYGAEAR